MDNSIHKKYTSSFMSNTKWRKLFQKINDKALPLGICFWKLVKIEEPILGWLPDAETMGDDHVSNIGDFEGVFLDPVKFCDIEWIDIPNRQGDQAYENAPIQYTYQDLGEVLKKIEAVGNFELEVTESYIRIYGHKP